MKRRHAGTILGAASLIVLGGMYAAPALARSKGDVNFFIGQKQLNQDDWEPVERQGEFGAEVTWGGAGWPIAIATDLVASSNGGDLSLISVDGYTSELALGVRKIWEAGATRPYVGGGVARIQGELKVNDTTEKDSTLGAWVGGGIFWRLGSRFNIGVAGRFSSGTVTLFGEDRQAGGSHLGLLLGWGWPGK